MRTRRGLCYSAPGVVTRMCPVGVGKRKSNKLQHNVSGDSNIYSLRKRHKRLPEKAADECDFFESLPDDLVISIFCKLSSSATSPSDFVNVLITCKRLNSLGLHSLIRFYCLQNRGSGASLMAKAAMNSHARALYSLAVIQFNGSGGTKNDKDLRAGVALCARAAFLGHVDALRELGHCLQDGYGVRQNIAEGRRFLVQANARELAAVISAGAAARQWLTWNIHPLRQFAGSAAGCPLLSDFGCNVPMPEAHPASRFLSEWFAARDASAGPGLRLCSHAGCGRPETRKHEFRRCSVCGAVNYCSRACQALDWKFRHKAECTPVERWLQDDGDDVVDDDVGADAVMAVDS
ncbi:hypothetical protein Ahy_A03g010165 isoform B [Arachis hypogaea]|uniref:MYND-type domain-containing protein n=1 Tax=Arachis hypogaea TaxID=3818 RepID=A0A445DLU8_ARAHY|nr:hypothetical protein Ahy_A03g010165 isoform A [Arachis hypogaea]RYR64006.1 hypothetical protein Ahy_A03g010165 isoform B [Arachis hypogaea]